MEEPGLDKDEWETEWQDLEERLAESPGEALAEVDDLISRMLAARGLAPGEPVPGGENQADTAQQLEQARSVARRVEAGEAVGPGDVGVAAAASRELYHSLLDRGPA